ncbi:MAG: zinc-dependent metalloprotease [Chitinophagales bacterium]|nr:zinc-dependent metalloprotease [Chitinophagales bacterium]
MKESSSLRKSFHAQRYLQIPFAMLFALVLCANSAGAQSSTAIFTFVSPYTGLSTDQTKIVNYATNQPHIGSVQYVSWASGNLLDANGKITVNLSGENGGQPISFDVIGSHFASLTEYALYGRHSLGEIALYITPQGKGGSITLVNSAYELLPLGGTMGVMIKLASAESGSSICATEPTSLEESGYCEDDCGSDVLDVLAMVTPAAQQWLDDNYGIFGLWFLFLETGNINGAFANSDIPNKGVRVQTIPYTPDFPLSISSSDDLSNLTNSSNAQQILQQRGCDVGILLTNQDYGNIAGKANSTDPTSINKFCIAQVASIGPVRYTFAHELAHQFGCQHHNVTNVPGCPHGMILTNSGKHTIMVFGSPNNNRIQHFSNPNVLFGNEPTGTSAFRNNAAQIRGAFCEVANNNPPAWFTVDVTHGSVIANDCPFTASASVQPGMMDILGNQQDCGTSYSYQWSWSGDGINYLNFGTNSPNLNLPIAPACPFFYLRVTVSTPNGCSAAVTKLLFCGNTQCSTRPEIVGTADTKMVEQNKVFPNPAQDKFSIRLEDFLMIGSVKARSANGTLVYTLPILGFEQGTVTCDVSNLPNGVWFIEVQEGDKRAVLKLTIMH